MRLSHVRSAKRVDSEIRVERMNPLRNLSADQIRTRALGMRQQFPAGSYQLYRCGFCGADLRRRDLVCPNDGPAWPHPKREASA